MVVTIKRKQVRDLLRLWMQRYRVVAPVQDGEVLVFQEVTDADKVVIDDSITYKSAKEFLFPQVEKVMSFQDDQQIMHEEVPPKTVIFGIRPCDLAALQVMHSVFTGGQFVDTFFLKHFENTLLVGVGCLQEKPGCFCKERKVDKGFSSDCDLFFRVHDDDFYGEPLTPGGEELLRGFDAPQVEEVPVAVAKDEGEAITLEITADQRRVHEGVDWESLVEGCMGCGVCTFLCPTCHCFEFRDVTEKGVSSRYRCWDSCMYPKFTLHASGHNPRTVKQDRYRQRVMHKFLYVKENTGHVACTGCGRCIRSCPAGMSIRTIVSDIMEDLT